MNHETSKNNSEKEKVSSSLEKALIASEIRYRRLFESAKDGILILDAETGMIVDVNPFLVNLLGYSKENFIQKAIWEIGFLKDIVQNKDKFLELQQNEYIRYEDLPLETANGQKIHVEFVSNVYLADNQKVIQCNIRDITEHWQMEKKIIDSEEKFRIITENSADAIFITDKEGKYLYANKSVANLLGYSEEELLSYSIADISPPNRLKEYYNIFQRLFKEGGSYSEIELVKKDGSFVPTDLNAVLLPNGWVYASCRDITKRKQLEEELLRSKNKAEESDRLKSAFLANMSHEIRTPLNGILGFTELLKTPRLSGSEQQTFIDIIEKSGTRMLNIINDIINISRIESGQIELSVSNVSMKELAMIIFDFFKPEAENKELYFSSENILSARDIITKTDKVKVYAILTNLVKNAIKFTQSGSIELGFEKKGKFIEFYVKDSGSGVLPKQEKLIFERFRQGSESLTRNYEGAGLGLAISKAYVEMLGGKIWIERNKVQGSTFRFTIPYLNGIEKKELLSASTGKIIFRPENLKILIVDDDETSRMLLEIIIKPLSGEVFQAFTGKDALEIYRKNPDIELVLMDINMPDMDGYEITRQIRAFNHEVVIIAQTAYALKGDREKAIKAGCNDHISKPLHRAKLIKMIEKYLAPMNV